MDLIKGDARDEQTLINALQGCAAVISSIGTPMSPLRKVTPAVDGDPRPGEGDAGGEGSATHLHHGFRRRRQPWTWGLPFDGLILLYSCEMCMPTTIARKIRCAPAAWTGYWSGRSF